jgi:hypothetical protein
MSSMGSAAGCEAATVPRFDGFDGRGRGSFPRRGAGNRGPLTRDLKTATSYAAGIARVARDFQTKMRLRTTLRC